MKSPVVTVRAAAATDVGRVRDGNEDSFFSGDTVFAVADGMGGHQAGEVASALALEPLQQLDGRQFANPEQASDALVDAIERSNRDVVERARSDATLRGMGTTLTAAIVQGDRLVTAHVGDSRAYLLRAGEPISQLTTDHTLVERLVREGRLSRDEVAAHPQRNVITRAIGNEPQVTVDALPPLKLEPGDVVLLCSDGLTGPLDDADIQTLVEVAGGGQDAVDALIAAANEAGGPDNITVVLLEVEGNQTAAGAVASVTSPVDTQVTDIPSERAPDGERPEDVDDEAHDRGIRHIRTTSSGDDDDWASTMGRLGARQGNEPGTRESSGGRSSPRRRRVIAGLFGVVILLALLAGGGYFLLSRAYFVGDYSGRVAIHRGLPETVAGIRLYWVLEDEISDVEVADLPAFRQADIGEGLSAGTLREARQVVTVLEQQVEDAATTPELGPTPSSSATTSPGT